MTTSIKNRGSGATRKSKITTSNHSHAKGILHKYYNMCRLSFQALLIVDTERADKMNENILRMLYNGRIFPAERGTEHITEYGHVSYKIAQEEAYWKEKLSTEDYERFAQLEPLYSKQEGLSKFDMFCYGFRLATQLFTESLSSVSERGNL